MHEMHSIQVQREKETLEKIKQKVERIKANQQKYEPNVISAKTHYEGRSNIDVKICLKCLFELSEFSLISIDG